MGLNHLPILLILAVVALIVFGPKRLPELGHGLGKAITEFKKGVADMTASGPAEQPVPESSSPLLAQATTAHPVEGADTAAPAAAAKAS